MNDLANPDSDLRAQARRWALVRAEGPLSPEQQRAFDRWLGADPRHALALRLSEGVLEDVARLDHLADLGRLDGSTPRSHIDRRLIVGGLLAASAVGAIGALDEWRRRAPVETRYETAVGESRQVALEDGSRVNLGPASRLRVRLGSRERHTVLEHGEAYFAIARNPDAPFVVLADQAQVRVLGTVFNVRSAAGIVRVDVASGRVRVTTRDGSGRSAELTPGQSALAAGARLDLGANDPGLVGAWRDGRLLYDNATLAEVVADARRYYPTGLSLSSPAVARLRVTAAFRTHDLDGFFADLQRVLPVRVRRRADGSVSIDARPVAEAVG